MASPDDEIKRLKETNNELVQKVQYWKMLAGQRENEKVDLMKEMNELRLKLSRLRSHGNVQANNLDAALQSASEKALSHLVRASSEIARTIDLTKAYMREREELDTTSPHWSNIGGTPMSVKKDKVHRVPPLMIGGQSIQPVVALTMLNASIPRTTARSPNPNRNVTERALPMHMLQDVYIPLTRIDADLQAQNMETEDADTADDSSEQLQLNDSVERLVGDESQRLSEDEEFDITRTLEPLAEDSEPEDDEVTIPRNITENPLEGPSWMLDAATHDESLVSKSRTLEPDSTTELEGFRTSPPISGPGRNNTQPTLQNMAPAGRRASHEFSPTVRRRKRASSPPPPPPPATPRLSGPFSPRPHNVARLSNSGRVLKVLVAKMRLDGEGGPAAEEHASPPKRAATGAACAFDAPSPNGATVPGVIVSEASQDELESLGSGEHAPRRRKQRTQHRSDGAPADRNTDTWDMDVDQPRTKGRTDRERSEKTDRIQRREERENEIHVSSRRRTNGRDSRQRTNGAEQTDGQRTNSAERASRRQGRHGGRELSAERDDDSLLRPDSRGSNDSGDHRESRDASGEPRYGSRDPLGSFDSDSGSGGEREPRSRRTRNIVTYKEKPLNRKLRR